MKKRLLLSLSILIAALSFVACQKAEPPVPPAHEPQGTISDAYQNFSANLFVKSIAHGENTLISPTSAYFTLAMVSNGASFNTAAAFDTVLGMPTAVLNPYCQNLTQTLLDTQGDTTLNIANSIWLNEGYTPKESFIANVTNTYGANVFEENLGDAKEPINLWVSEKTNTLIPEFLKESPDPNTQMMLINALYLKAAWMNPFLPELTADRSFNLADGTTINTPFLNSPDSTKALIDTADAEGILLPYNDDRFAFVALRPKNGQSVADFVASFKKETLPHYLSQTEYTTVNLSMPKFTVDYTFNMNQALIDMGLSDAFNSTLADFSNMTDQNDLFISDALQKTKIIIDENGTEAAATTSVAMDVKSMPAPPDSVRELVLDSPYAYFIVNLEGSEPLFMGTMDRPVH